jgi:hypothetical protein
MKQDQSLRHREMSQCSRRIKGVFAAVDRYESAHSDQFKTLHEKQNKGSSICLSHYTFVRTLVTFGRAEKDEVHHNHYSNDDCPNNQPAMFYYHLSHASLSLVRLFTASPGSSKPCAMMENPSYRVPSIC